MIECFAFMETNGQIDLDSLAEDEEQVKFKVLEGAMGWRFEYPDRYNREEEWVRLQAFGKVVKVRVCLVAGGGE